MANSPISALPNISDVTNTTLVYVDDVNEALPQNRSKNMAVSQIFAGMANATTSVPGLMAAADKTVLTNATTAATPSTLMLRDSSGNTVVNSITAANLYSTNSPTTSTQVANKAYVDAAAAGLSVLSPAAAATVGTNISLSSGAPSTLDGVALTTSTRILVKDQTTASENGVYVPSVVGTGSNGTWVRSTDANTTGQLKTGTYVFIAGGTVNLNTAYVITTTGTITIGSTAIVWTLYSSISSINAASIVGLISASQIGSVNANSIFGSITAGQIGSITAGQITGSLTASQIGAVNAGSIVGSITASQIATVNASSITGSVAAGQIGSVSASTITGSITSGQIGSVSATTITGSITSGQISTVNATSITGVVVTNQLATGILNSLSLIANNLMVIQQVSSLPTLPNTSYPVNCFVLDTTNKTMYQNIAGTWTASSASSNLTGTLTAADISSVNATSITGLILAAQISTVNTSSFVGSITSSQIGSVSASSITGSITSSQISSVAATSITGSITSGQIGSVAASAITGSISSGQISSVNASAITGSISASQISSVNATSIVTGSLNAVLTVGSGSIQAGSSTTLFSATSAGTQFGASGGDHVLINGYTDNASVYGLNGSNSLLWWVDPSSASFQATGVASLTCYGSATFEGSFLVTGSISVAYGAATLSAGALNVGSTGTIYCGGYGGGGIVYNGSPPIAFYWDGSAIVVTQNNSIVGRISVY